VNDIDLQKKIEELLNPIFKQIKQLQAENELQYKKGYEDGVRAYAWWKDGVQYVGSCGKTLEQALKDV